MSEDREPRIAAVDWLFQFDSDPTIRFVPFEKSEQNCRQDGGFFNIRPRGLHSRMQRLSTTLLTALYLALTVGIPQDLRCPATGCRCGDELQQSNLCCCAKATGRSGEACRSNTTPMTSTLSTQLPPCCAQRLATSHRSIACPSDKGSPSRKQNPAPCPRWSRCCCHSGPVAGTIGISEPRLPPVNVRLCEAKSLDCLVWLPPEPDSHYLPQLDTPPPESNPGRC